MKIFALLLILLAGVFIVVLGLMYFFGFIMSFDAPGSTTDPKAWGARIAFFMPVLVLIIAVAFAIYAYYTGNYVRSVRIGLAIGIVTLAIVVFMMASSSASMRGYKEAMAKEAELTRLYPEERYLRTFDGGADTVIVFPTGTVAYRLLSNVPYPYNGPLGDLNEQRTTISYRESSDTKLNIGELDQFVDDQGRRLTEVYEIK